MEAVRMSRDGVECPDCGGYFDGHYEQRDHAESVGHRVTERCREARNASLKSVCRRQKYHPGMCSKESHNYGHVSWESPLQKAMLPAVKYEAAASVSGEQTLDTGRTNVEAAMHQFANVLGYPVGPDEDASVDRTWFLDQYVRWFETAVETGELY